MRIALVVALVALQACVRRPAPSINCGNDPPPVYGSAIAWERTGDGTLEGLVTDIAGKPLTGAWVQLKGTRLAAESDKNGRFSIERVPARDYTITALLIGYVRAERSISLGNGEGARVLAILERGPSSLHYDCFQNAARDLLSR